MRKLEGAHNLFHFPKGFITFFCHHMKEKREFRPWHKNTSHLFPKYLTQLKNTRRDTSLRTEQCQLANLASDFYRHVRDTTCFSGRMVEKFGRSLHSFMSY